MGIWGHKLFEECDFADVKRAFMDHVADGRTPQAATRQMVKDWNLSRLYAEGYAGFWLSLAAVQWEMGRLTPRVLRMAIKIIDSEFGLNAYGEASPQVIKSQRAGYRAIRARLLRNQPPPKKVPGRFYRTTDWEIGDLVSYRCLSGRLIYIRVLGISQDRGGAILDVDICRWRRGTLPSAKAISNKNGLQESPRPDRMSQGRFSLYERRAGELPSDRVSVVGKGFGFPTRTHPLAVFGGWSKFDEYLKVTFGIR